MTTDHVDVLMRQWRRERPDLDPAPMGVFGRISRLAALLQHELEAVFDRYGLVRGDLDVLATLRGAGPPYRLTPGELTRATMVTTGGMTKRLDRLEARGLVRRDPDPTDRRGRLIGLTDQGRTLVDEVVQAELDNEERLLARLPTRDRERLARLLRSLLLQLEGPRN